MKRVLEFYTKYFAIWVIVGGILAYCFPGPFLALKPFNKAFFGLTMFGIGAVLKPEDFTRIARKPLIVLIGSCAQFTIMPIGAFIIARVFRLPPEMAVGLILAGCVPGAMASNVMSYIAKADAAYSVYGPKGKWYHIDMLHEDHMDVVGGILGIGLETLTTHDPWDQPGHDHYMTDGLGLSSWGTGTANQQKGKIHGEHCTWNEPTIYDFWEMHCERLERLPTF